MKNILITIAALVLVGCGELQQSGSKAEVKPKPPTVQAPQESISWLVKIDPDIEKIKQHLAAGTPVDKTTDRDGRTPLLCAMKNVKGKNTVIEKIDIVKLLISAGANIHSESRSGEVPLHLAAEANSIDIIKLLIKKGADVNAKDDYGATPLDDAKHEKQTADLLRKHGGKTGEELKAEGK